MKGLFVELILGCVRYNESSRKNVEDLLFGLDEVIRTYKSEQPVIEANPKITENSSPRMLRIIVGAMLAIMAIPLIAYCCLRKKPEASV